jgi:hypothetical protein
MFLLSHREGRCSCCKTPPPGLLTQAAALFSGLNTDEYLYLYLNFTANAQRGTLLYALDARSPGYAIEMSMGELSKETLLRPTPLQIRCVCLLLQDLVQSCLRGGGGILEDMCYERRRAEACPLRTLKGCCLLLQYLIQSCARGGRRIVENMCYEIRQTNLRLIAHKDCPRMLPSSTTPERKQT